MHALQSRECRRDDVIGKKQQGADDGKVFGGVFGGRIDAPAVGVAAADNGISPSHGGDQNAHAADVPETGMETVEKSQAQHVETAGAPVAKQHGTGVIPLQFARTFGVGNEHATSADLPWLECAKHIPEPARVQECAFPKPAKSSPLQRLPTR